MEDALVALGLVLAVEGALYALFPEGMRRAIAMALALPADQLRLAGAVAALLGVGIVWLVRG